MVPTALTVELAYGVGRAFRQLPGWAQAALVVAGVAGGVGLQRNERTKDQLTRFGSAVRDVGKTVWPLVQVVLEREVEAQRVWSENAVDTGPVALSEKVARALALSGTPMTAAELAREVQGHESLRSAEAAIRDDLRKSSAFHEVSRGRWELGRMASQQEPTVITAQVADWVQRSHRREPKRQEPRSNQSKQGGTVGGPA
jgi:hypothetical protein